MKKVVYLTFNDSPGGIFTSQVIDVCRFLRDDLAVQVQLVSFVSLRNYFENRKKIKAQFSNAIVLPMWPGIDNWRKNKTLLQKKLKRFAPDTIIARGPFATVLARASTNARVCFDARGAYAAEFSEYGVGGGKISGTEVRSVEARAITECDCAIVVSNALVNYWKKEFGYHSDKHRVIPCTVAGAPDIMPEYSQHEKVRIVFSGGSGKWQSTQLISDILTPYFETHSNVELLMLTQQLPADFPLAKKFPGRVSQKWVSEKQVPEILRTCDYGWMVRENSVTNQVASPVKFAEYLASGLSVIISSGLGDFSGFVEKNNCGIVLRDEQMPLLEKISADQKKRNRELAMNTFTKKSYSLEYQFCIG